jgi:Brp/Blh family beta-carotene 15,15'-monooxygenase
MTASSHSIQQPDALTRGIFTTSLVALGVAVPATLLVGGAEMTRVGIILLLVSAVLLGMPHGAVDHLVLMRLAGGSGDGFSGKLLKWARVLAPYLALIALYGLVWFFLPRVALIFFLALTIFHWGQADVADLLRTGKARYLGDRPRLRATATLLRGALPILGPLLFFPEAFAQTVALILGRFETLDAGAFALFFQPETRALLAILLGGLFLGYYGRVIQLAGVRSVSRDLAGSAAVLTFFALVPPLAAIAFYFLFRHSLRHLDRLRVFFHEYSAALGEGARAFGRLWLATVPMTALALVLMVPLYFLAPNQPATVAETLGLYLVLISLLTLPHAWVVWRMDRKAFAEYSGNETTLSGATVNTLAEQEPVTPAPRHLAMKTNNIS